MQAAGLRVFYNSAVWFCFVFTVIFHFSFSFSVQWDLTMQKFVDSFGSVAWCIDYEKQSKNSSPSSNIVVRQSFPIVFAKARREKKTTTTTGAIHYHYFPLICPSSRRWFEWKGVTMTRGQCFWGGEDILTKWRTHRSFGEWLTLLMTLSRPAWFWRWAFFFFFFTKYFSARVTSIGDPLMYAWKIEFGRMLANPRNKTIVCVKLFISTGIHPCVRNLFQN